MSELKIYCVTDKVVNFIDKNNYYLCWVGKSESPKGYLKCDSKENIFYKEKFYSELTFHYWYWKNLLSKEKEDNWIGFCQKRRFWINTTNKNNEINQNNINDFLITKPSQDWSKYDVILCNRINVFGAKKIKILKRGFRNFLTDPLILFNKYKQNISLHFDMHHGYGNLDKAITILDNEDREEFKKYVKNNNKFNPHIMFITKPSIAKKWFEDLFSWLEKCEEIFKFENLKGYDTQRLFAFLSERYLSYWFKKNYKCKEENWIQLDHF